jgi:MATE family multidrug resistance protein
LQPLGNHGLWLAFLCFMLLRGLSLGGYAYRLSRHDRWFGAVPALCARPAE